MNQNKTQQLKALSRTLIVIQEFRIANFNRLVKVPKSQGVGCAKPQKAWKSKAEILDELNISAPLTMDTWQEYFTAQLKVFNKIEKDLLKVIKRTLKEHVIWKEFLKDIQGIGPIIAASLIGEINDINRFERTSDLWAYAGKHVIDGEAAKRKKGKKANWNKYIPLALWKFSESVIKMNKKGHEALYRKLYDERKKYEQKHHKETCKRLKENKKCSEKLHIHLRSTRYIQKKLLSDLYWFWKGID